MERLLVQKIADVMHALTEKKIVNMWPKNIALLIQSKKKNMLIAKNYLLNAPLIVIFSLNYKLIFTN